MLFFRFIAQLPLAFLYVISDFLFFLTYHVVKYRRALVRKNLSNAFPERAPKEISTIEKEFYHNLGDYTVETLKLLTIKKDELGHRVIFKNLEMLEKYALSNQSVLILASHQFNWEWLLASGNFSLPIPIDFVYQPIENKIVDQFLLSCRTRFGAHPIKRNELAREIVKRKNVLRGVAIISDQYPGQKRDKKHLTTFLHQETAFFYGTHQLASLTQYPVIYAEMRKVKRGYYEVSFVPLAEPPYEKDNEIIERYVNAAEKVIRDYPSGWLWSHNRWKTRHLKQASAKYPPASAAS
jgi:Kdo2-lipid IVA lauroyltransferase/acyltransferase